MSDQPDPPEPMAGTSPTAREALHLTVDADFDDVVPYVQLEHELVGFETVRVTRLDQLIEGVLGETAPRTALIVTCHAEIARDALAIDQRLAALLPCSTVVYERPDDDRVHVHHVSATKAIRDLGYAPEESEAAVQALVDRTSELMAAVWENIEEHAGVIGGTS